MFCVFIGGGFVHWLTGTVVFDKRIISIIIGRDGFMRFVGRMNGRRRGGRRDYATSGGGDYNKRRVCWISRSNDREVVAFGAMSGMRLLLFLFGSVFVTAEQRCSVVV